MRTNVILTVVGSDRPGLVQAVADAVLAVDGNWLESHLAHLAGKFVGAVLVEVPAARLPDLEARLRKADAAGLQVSLVDAPAPPEPPAGRLVALELVGQDRPGIVREVTAALAGRKVNIEDFATELAHGSWSGERLFRATASLRVPPAVALDSLRETLERLSAELMVDLSLTEADKG